MSHPILLYDGGCGLCNRFVQFILRRDRNAVFRFASLQSALAAPILTRHGANPGVLDTVYVALNHELPNEYLLTRSDAVLFVLSPHYGGRMQLQKIAMLNGADLVALNKCDDPVARTASAEIAARLASNGKDQPLHATVAARHHDPGVDRLYAAMAQMALRGCFGIRRGGRRGCPSGGR